MGNGGAAVTLPNPPSRVISLQRASVQLGQRARAVHALNGIDLVVSSGERVALIGANGSGKSTLLRVMSGLQPVSSGVFEAALEHRAMVFQRPFLLRLSVLRNVALGPWLAGVPWRQARIRAQLALRQVGLEALADRSAHTLSGGQQQRVAIARAWACAPKVLFLDEPSANLDPHAKHEVESLVQQLSQQDASMTVVFASHNLGQVKRLATRVLYLEAGQIAADLPVTAFFAGEQLERDYPRAHGFVRGYRI